MKETYRGKIVRVIQQEVEIGGKKKIFESAERSPGVRILATSGDKILLNLESRGEVAGGQDYRLPGGKVIDKIDDYVDFLESGKDIHSAAKLAAKKELGEESSLDMPISDFHVFHVSHAGSTIIWDLYYYHVDIPEDMMQEQSISTHEGEEIQTGWYSHEQVMKMALSGKIQEDRSLAVLLKFLLT